MKIIDTEGKGDTMPICKERKGSFGFCEGSLRKSNWLPASGEDPVLREYKCATCDAIVYLKTGRLQKVEGQNKPKTMQPNLL